MLENILISLGFVRPEIGYCQGMNFIAGALINLIDDEEKCFWIFLTFIDNIQLNLLYLKNMPDFLIRVYQLKNFMNTNKYRFIFFKVAFDDFRELFSF